MRKRPGRGRGWHRLCAGRAGRVRRKTVPSEPPPCGYAAADPLPRPLPAVSPPLTPRLSTAGRIPPTLRIWKCLALEEERLAGAGGHVQNDGSRATRPRLQRTRCPQGVLFFGASVSTWVQSNGWTRPSRGPSSSDFLGFSAMLWIRLLVRIQGTPSGEGLAQRGEMQVSC